ncbi:MAG: peptide chain release factor 1 [Xanthomonadaceae bacterium]|nr:peptide chain release factor 1 [Xanthomonadaceae bacterium]MDE2224267.1 peptide chain release factor 1 [Xanthomonadaceae bacterium]
MNPHLQRRLEQLLERHHEVGLLLAEPDAAADPKRFRDLSREYAQAHALAEAFATSTKNTGELAHARAMLADPDLRELAREEVARLEAEATELDERLQALLIPRDPLDDANLFLEVRAGTGGDEAALFAGDLLRMYLRYAERRGWRTEILSAHGGEHGGYKEAVARVEGGGAYAALKFESGTHRVQRVPVTEASGRIHTSAATVAILPEQEDITDIELRDADLRVDTFRASGAGGQHVNKTDSAIRITHLPTGIVVECQDERSQHKNRARALSLLKARLLDSQRAEQAATQAATRKLQVGSGDRSQRIRTYNFPQGRVTDHRINLTLHKLPEIIDGDLDDLIHALAREAHAEALTQLAERA